MSGKANVIEVKLDTIRDGKHQTVTVTLGSRPNRQVQEPTPGG